MTICSEDEIKTALGMLVGRRLTAAKNAADMKMFGFGEVREIDEKHTAPELSLHLMCPWRIEDRQRRTLITGLSDYYEAGSDAGPDWHATNGAGSLQNERMQQLLWGELGYCGAPSGTADTLVVTEVQILPCFGLQIDLSPNYRIVVFPCGSRGEQWRFLSPGTDAPHYVLDDARVVIE